MSLFHWRVWQSGVKSLLLHPMRSLLTVLGIFIGVASVIWLLAIGEGISAKAQEQIAGLGTDNIIVRSVQPAGDSVTSNFIAAYGVTRDDFERLLETIPSIDNAIPVRELRRQFRCGGRIVDGRLVGSTPDYATLYKLELARGRFISHTELEQKSNVCVLSASVAEQLFPYEDPIGRAIHVEQDYYVVVGVLKPRDALPQVNDSVAAQDFTSDVYAPITTFWSRIGDLVVTRRSGSRVSEIIELTQVTLKVKDQDAVLRTAEVVRETLASHHKEMDYTITVPMELLEQARTTRLMFMAMMGAIAAISLVVGGIGIMNIMLATVTERTREIGIRRALGAKRGDITRQFLAETIVLSIAGGLTGILGGLACAPLFVVARDGVLHSFPALARQLPEMVFSLKPIVVPWSLPVAFGISVVIGVVFGLYPARRAARMNPIEALRHVA